MAEKNIRDTQPQLLKLKIFSFNTINEAALRWKKNKIKSYPDEPNVTWDSTGM